MNKLIAELQRLYFLDGQQGQCVGGQAPAAGALTPAIVASGLAGECAVALDLVGADGSVRAMVVDFSRSSDWAQVARLYQAVQDDLNLPAPALCVCRSSAYALWFSLAEPVPVTQAGAFLAALRQRYLAELPAQRLTLHPDAELAAAVALLPPSMDLASGSWSAFIDPSLGAMFIAEPWLDMAPNPDKQADLLARLQSIKSDDFQKAGILLEAAADAAGAERVANEADDSRHPAPEQTLAAPRRPPSTLNVGADYRDPESFLRAVMNDPSASARQRIAAAKALLPYFRKKIG